MLTDAALRNLKLKSKIYKASDRDGMYVTVSPSGTVTFRYDCRLNGRRETLTIGRYGPAGVSLALAREKLIDAKKAVALGKSPALEKQREKRRLTPAKTFGEVTEKWLAGARMADSTKEMRKSIVDRDILPVFQNRQLNEISADDLHPLQQGEGARCARDCGTRPRHRETMTVGTPIVELIFSSSFQRPGCVIEIADRLRRQAYEQAGKRCRVCGGRGPPMACLGRRSLGL